MKILHLSIPGWHLGSLGCYGNDWIDTRTLDTLASESVVFDQHFADCLHDPSSAFTGRYPFAGQDHTSLATLLEDNGFHTASILAPPRDSVSTWKDRWHQWQNDLDNTLGQLSSDNQFLIHAQAPDLMPPWSIPDEVLDDYFPEAEYDPENEETVTPPPLLDPAEDTNAATTQRARVQFTYAALISHVDHCLDELLVHVRRRMDINDLTLVLTSSRGLALGEHGIISDRHPWLHEEVVHIPLILRLPQAENAGRRVGTLTQPIDLFATFLEMCRISPPRGHSHSLLPLIRGQTNRVRDYACAGWKLGDEQEWLLRTADWSVLVPEPKSTDRQIQLYAKPADRWEVNNVYQHHRELAEPLTETLRAVVEVVSSNEVTELPSLPEDVYIS